MVTVHLCLFFRLDEALSQYFGEGAEVAQQEEIYPTMPEPIQKCPQCNRDMVLKTKKNGGLVPSFCLHLCLPSTCCVSPRVLKGPISSCPCHIYRQACCWQSLGKVLELVG